MKVFFLFAMMYVNTSYSQNIGITYHNQSFTFDSLLSIAKDTIAYITAVKNNDLQNLLESDAYQAVKVFAKKQLFDDLFTYASYCLSKGQTVESIFSATGSVMPEFEKQRIINVDCKAKETFFNKISKDVYDEINKIAALDAKYRDLYMYGKIKYDIVRANDSINFINLKTLIGKVGMITERRWGSIFNNFFYIIIHCCYYRPTDYEYMRGLFYKAVINGDAKPDLYAYFVDRYTVDKTGGQMYGSMANPDEGTGKINNIENINKTRASIGACNLKNWLLLRNIDLKHLPEHYEK